MIKAKVLNAELDENANIRVSTEYTLTDGSKRIGHTRYNFVNFSREKIMEDIQDHCKTLMTKIYSLKEHQKLVNTTIVSDLEHECTQAEILLKHAEKDSNGNIIKPEEKIIIDDS